MQVEQNVFSISIFTGSRCFVVRFFKNQNTSIFSEKNIKNSFLVQTRNMLLKMFRMQITVQILTLKVYRKTRWGNRQYEHTKMRLANDDTSILLVKVLSNEMFIVFYSCRFFSFSLSFVFIFVLCLRCLRYVELTSVIIIKINKCPMICRPKSNRKYFWLCSIHHN